MTSKRLFQSVAEQIAGLIDDGAYPAGTRLPGERELAEKLGVSRVTIREAEIALQAVGRLEIKTGSGVYVSESAPVHSAALPKASAFEVTEARLLVESESAALAARNISDEGIAKLAGLVEQMRSGDQQAADEADEKFHMTIAEASNNAAMVHTIQSLWRMREEIPEVKVTYGTEQNDIKELVASGGVTAKTFFIPLPRPVLSFLRVIDDILCTMAPQTFALQRRAVLEKIA